jgi:hypothetical protein
MSWEDLGVAVSDVRVGGPGAQIIAETVAGVRAAAMQRFATEAHSG